MVEINFLLSSASYMQVAALIMMRTILSNNHRLFLHTFTKFIFYILQHFDKFATYSVIEVIMLDIDVGHGEIHPQSQIVDDNDCILSFLTFSLSLQEDDGIWL